MNPFVSVIIPNYNHAAYLQQRIDSVINQTYQNFEIILLDDCSSDNSKEIIEKYRGNEKVKKIIYNDLNSGSTFKQWKKGMEATEAELIWIAESDDYAELNFLEVLVKPFDIYDDLVISYCRSFIADESNNISGLALYADILDEVRWTKDHVAKGSIELEKYLKYRNTIPNASAVIFKKPKDIDIVLRTDMRFCADWLFWKNLLKENGKIAYSHFPLNCFRHHSATTRFLSETASIETELKRFKEYRMFFPDFFINPFDNRLRWMLEHWVHREKLFINTSYYYKPILHPALALRYYLYLLKRKIKSTFR